MVSEEGAPGDEDNFVRITGETTDSHNLGLGPIPLALDSVTGDAEWLTDPFPDGTHRFRFVGAAAPEDCGSIETVDPETP